MRVLVTGIEGFVGSHLAEFLLTIPGVEVHGTVLGLDRTKNIDHLKSSSLHLHPIDLLDTLAVTALFSDLRPSRIIHLAGQAFVPTSIQDPAGTFRTNIDGGISVLEAVRKITQSQQTRPGVIIISTGEVYGRVDPEKQPIREDMPIRPNNPYAASKASIDMIAQQYAWSFGVNVVVVRPFNHAGPRQSPVFVVSDFARQFAEIVSGKKQPIMHVGDIGTKRDFTDVRDVVRAYWSLFEEKPGDIVFNVCSGRALEIREVLMMLQEISGTRVEIKSEQTRLRPYDVPVVVGSYERLKKATGWCPTIPFRQTVKDVFEYWIAALKERG